MNSYKPTPKGLGKGTEAVVNTGIISTLQSLNKPVVATILEPLNSPL